MKEKIETELTTLFGNRFNRNHHFGDSLNLSMEDRNGTDKMEYK